MKNEKVKECLQHVTIALAIFHSTPLHNSHTLKRIICFGYKFKTKITKLINTKLLNRPVVLRTVAIGT